MGFCSFYRIIPARAGSTFTLMLRCRLTGDHPRSRGEHQIENAQQKLKGGSSPLARGAQHRG